MSTIIQCFQYFNNAHISINFNINTEINDGLSFLDVQINVKLIGF